MKPLDYNVTDKKYSFFRHEACEYFPCHKVNDEENFNCLFCYCPLYVLGKKCGGNFKYIEDAIKDCSHCLVPHKRDSYAFVISKYFEILEFMKKNEHKDQ
jgi:Zn-finger protein